jgi:hypothetical protein
MYYSDNCLNRPCATRKAIGTFDLQKWDLNLRPHRYKAKLLAIWLWHCVHVGVCVCVSAANILQYPTTWLLWSKRIWQFIWSLCIKQLSSVTLNGTDRLWYICRSSVTNPEFSGRSLLQCSPFPKCVALWKHSLSQRIGRYLWCSSCICWLDPDKRNTNICKTIWYSNSYTRLN